MTDKPNEMKTPRREYFSFRERTKQFDVTLTGLIQNLLREERAKIINPENEMRYSHGIKWVSVSSDASNEEGEMKVHSTETVISMQDVREHKLSALPSFINDLVKKMHGEMQRMMYQTVNDSCEKSGRTVSTRDHATTADAFLASLKTLEFGVDRQGKVSLPTFHVGSQAFAAFKRDAEAKGPEFEAEVDKVIKEKSEAALEREKQRLARFKS